MSNSSIHACKTIVLMCEEARAMGKKHLRINKIENLADQAVQEDMSEERNNRPSPWHTGTPTEEGWYLLKCSYLGCSEYIYDTKYFTFDSELSENVIEWQKIEEGEVTNER